jgi:hypothetical protein
MAMNVPPHGYEGMIAPCAMDDEPTDRTENATPNLMCIYFVRSGRAMYEYVYLTFF